MSGMEGMTGLGGMMSSQDPEATQAAANMNTAVAAQEAGRGFGIADTGGVAPTGFNAAPGIGEAFGALGRGEISLAEALGYAAQSAFSPPGIGLGVSVDQFGVQTPAVSIDPVGLGLGLAGFATGVPGLGTLGGMIGSQVSQALGISPGVVSFGTSEFGGATNTGNVGSSVGGMGSGNAGSGAAADGNAIQNIDQDLAALNQRYGEQLSGGMVEGQKSLEELHRRYAEGGEVGGEGMVRPYDPREVDTIASEFMRGISPGAIAQLPGIMYPAIDRRRAF
jgi:hypothetical protein